MLVTVDRNKCVFASVVGNSGDDQGLGGTTLCIMRYELHCPSPRFSDMSWTCSRAPRSSTSTGHPPTDQTELEWVESLFADIFREVPPESASVFVIDYSPSHNPAHPSRFEMQFTRVATRAEITHINTCFNRAITDRMGWDPESVTMVAVQDWPGSG